MEELSCLIQREREKKRKGKIFRDTRKKDLHRCVNIQDFSSSISQITFKRLEEKSNYEFKKKIRQDAFLHESYLGSNVPFYSIFPPRSPSSHWISNIFWFRAWLLEKLHRYTRPCFDREKRERERGRLEPSTRFVQFILYLFPRLL